MVGRFFPEEIVNFNFYLSRGRFRGTIRTTYLLTYRGKQHAQYLSHQAGGGQGRHLYPDQDNGRLNLRTIDHLARVISECQNRGYEMVLVTSAAISIGAQKLGMEERPTELRFKQAAAAVGQGELMHLYNKCFAEYGHNVAQILLTHEDIIHVSRRRNLINTFVALFISAPSPSSMRTTPSRSRR